MDVSDSTVSSMNVRAYRTRAGRDEIANAVAPGIVSTAVSYVNPLAWASSGAKLAVRGIANSQIAGYERLAGTLHTTIGRGEEVDPNVVQGALQYYTGLSAERSVTPTSSDGEFSSEEEPLDTEEPQSAIAALVKDLLTTPGGIEGLVNFLVSDLFEVQQLEAEFRTPEGRLKFAEQLGVKLALRFANPEQEALEPVEVNPNREHVQKLAAALAVPIGQVLTEDNNYTIDFATDTGRYAFVNDLLTRIVKKQLGKLAEHTKTKHPEGCVDLLAVVEEQLSLIAQANLKDSSLNVRVRNSDQVMQSAADLIVAALATEKPVTVESLEEKFASLQRAIGLKGTRAASKLANTIVASIKAKHPLPDKYKRADGISLDLALVKGWRSSNSDQEVYLGLLRTKGLPAFISEDLLVTEITMAIMATFKGLEARFEAEKGDGTVEEYLLGRMAEAGRLAFDLGDHRDPVDPYVPEHMGAAGKQAIEALFGPKLNDLHLHGAIRQWAVLGRDLLTLFGPNLDELILPQLDSLVKNDKIDQLLAGALHGLNSKIEASGNRDIYDLMLPHPLRSGKAAPKAAEAARVMSSENTEADKQVRELLKRLINKCVAPESQVDRSLIDPQLLKTLKDNGLWDLILDKAIEAINPSARLRALLRTQAGVEDSNGNWSSRQLLNSGVYAAILKEPAAPVAESPGEVHVLADETQKLMIFSRGLTQCTGLFSLAWCVVTRLVARILAEVIATVLLLLDLPLRSRRATEAWEWVRQRAGVRTDAVMQDVNSVVLNKLRAVRKGTQLRRVINSAATALFRTRG